MIPEANVRKATARKAAVSRGPMPIVRQRPFISLYSPAYSNVPDLHGPLWPEGDLLLM